MKLLSRSVIFCLWAFVFISGLCAQTLPQPKGAVILEVTGNITHTNTSQLTAKFDRDMLLALNSIITVKTSTPWSEGVDEYRGPLLKSLLEAVGAKSSMLLVTALNDYGASVPVQDAIDFDVILAMDINGKPMRVREKGPLYLLYPFDDVPSLKNEVIYNRSVWQIKSIKVE